MNIQSHTGNHFTTFTLSGRFDAVSAPSIEEAFNRVMEEGSLRFVVNLADLEYISSAGLRVLLATAKKLSKQNGKIVLFSLRKDVHNVLEISGLLGIFPVAGDQATAETLVKE